MAGMSLGQAMQRRHELEQEKLSMGRQKLNDDYELGKMQIGASLNRGGTQPAQSSSMNNIAQINSNASTAAAGAFNSAYQKPTSAISNPSPGVFGDIGSMSSFEDMQKPPAYKRGTTRVKDKTGKGNPKKDTVPAMLAQDEAVLNAGAARILGRKRIADLNAQGLSSMGMQGAQPEFKDGAVHAYGGIDFNDPAMKAQAQNMEMQRRLAQAPRQPVMNSSLTQSTPIEAAPVREPVRPLVQQAARVPGTSMVPVGKPTIASMQRPPVYGVTEMGDPYEKAELDRNAQRARAGQAAQANAAKARAAQSAPLQKPSIAGRAVGVGGKVLRTAMSAPAAAVLALLESANAGAAGDDLDFAPGGRFRTEPKRNIASMTAAPAARPVTQPVEVVNTQLAGPDRAAQAAELDAKSRQYVEGPLSGRTTDLSNADFAAQGMGDIAKIVGKDGKTTYTNIGNRNPYNNEEAQARTVGYKAGEKARAESVAEQTATPADLERQAAQFAMGQGRKLADLQQQFVSEPDATKRATIAENIGIMSGKTKEPPKRRDIVSTKQKTVDAEGVEQEVPIMYDPETGQLIDLTGSQKVASTTRAEYDKMPAGSRYIGTDGKTYIKGK